MAPSQPLRAPTNKAPWQTRQLPYALKLLVGFGAGLLLVMALITGILLVTIVPSTIVNGPGPRDTLGSIIAMVVIIGGLFGISVVGIILLYPYVSSPTTFKTSYGPVPPEVAAMPFEIKFRRGGLGRSLTGKGSARFDGDALVVEGYLTPSPLLQLAIIGLLTVLPLLLFGVGLGIIPALVLAYYVGRKKLNLRIPTYELRDLSLKGCEVTGLWPGHTPQKIAFYVASSDGERLYREVAARWPALVPIS